MTGKGQCGVPCKSDWYCDWWQDGLPPWFYDPLDPNNPYKASPPLPSPTSGGPGGSPAGEWPHQPLPTPPSTTTKPTEPPTQPPTDPPKGPDNSCFFGSLPLDSIGGFFLASYTAAKNGDWHMACNGGRGIW